MRTAARAGIGTIGAIALLGIGAAIGSAGAANSGSTAAGRPAPTVTKTQYVATPGPTVTNTRTIHAKPPGPKAVMTGDGVYVVGTDIAPGIYHTSGAVGGSGGNCYVALLASTNTSDIVDNNNVTGPDTVTVGPGVHAMETEGCQPWHKVGNV
jgi:hypothetical protein